MRLKEHEAKRLFASAGIPIPRGELVRRGATDTLTYPLIAKVQTFDGGRGKRGGVRRVDSPAELEALLDAWARGSELLPPVAEVLAEEPLEIDRELYLSMSIDRDHKSIVIMASPHGGVDVESADPDSFLRIFPRSAFGLSAADARVIARHLDIAEPQRQAFETILTALWRVTTDRHCLLAEVNPLVVTTAGTVFAADARVVLDDSALHDSEHVDEEGSDFERAVAAAGAVGAELDGDVAVLTSGAGLGMATLDLVAAEGFTPACLIDFGGVVFRGTDALAGVLATLHEIQPTTVFINVFLQVGPCDDLAEAVLTARDAMPETDFVLRLRGRNEPRAHELLDGSGVHATRDLNDALRLLRTVKEGTR